MESDKENTVRTPGFGGTPAGQSLLNASQQDGGLGSNRNTPIRPLTAAYRTARSDNEVSSIHLYPCRKVWVGAFWELLVRTPVCRQV